MAEFEKIAKQEKERFTLRGVALYPQHSDFLDKVLVYGKSGRFDEREDTGLTDSDFESMLSDITAQAPGQHGDQLTVSFNILCEMLTYIESEDKKISNKIAEQVKAAQSTLRKLLAASID